MPIVKCKNPKCNSSCLVANGEPAPETCNNCNEQVQKLISSVADEIEEHGDEFLESEARYALARASIEKSLKQF